MVRFAKFKNWYTLENDPCLIIQVLSTLELPKSPNSRNFRLAKIKCFTVLGISGWGKLFMFMFGEKKPLTIKDDWWSVLSSIRVLNETFQNADKWQRMNNKSWVLQYNYLHFNCSLLWQMFPQKLGFRNVTVFIAIYGAKVLSLKMRHQRGKPVTVFYTSIMDRVILTLLE